MEALGFKKLTKENWLQADKLKSYFVRYSEEGDLKQITGEDRLEDIYQSDLIDEVSVEIRRLFEVARGAIAYGYYFYPLYTLGAEQLFRVMESAVNYKCKTIGCPASIKDLMKK